MHAHEAVKMSNQWLYLILAGFFEVCWSVAMKLSDGLKRPLPTVVLAVTMALSVVLLSKALQTLSLGTAYAVWTGIGAAGAAIVGVMWFGESASPLRIVSILLIVFGTVGLHITET